VVYTDGLVHAGERLGTPMDVFARVGELLEEQDLDAERWADTLLSRAIELDQSRPADDMSVVVAAILPGAPDETRRLSVRMPI
jgi:serine phosphatase RsbU (regulator of sigma subunit)